MGGHIYLPLTESKMRVASFWLQSINFRHFFFLLLLPLGRLSFSGILSFRMAQHRQLQSNSMPLPQDHISKVNVNFQAILANNNFLAKCMETDILLLLVPTVLFRYFAVLYRCSNTAQAPHLATCTICPLITFILKSLIISDI